MVVWKAQEHHDLEIKTVTGHKHACSAFKLSISRHIQEAMPGLPGKLKIPVRYFTRYSNYLLASVDLDECIERLYKKELLADSVVEAICAKTKELLMKESNVVHIAAPVTVVGDIHGQFFDLIEIFKIGGFCPDTNYLFLGM